MSDPVALDAAAVSDLGEPLASGRDTPMPRRLWPARHGAPIQAVFGSEDGDAAVSVDAGGHVRLWPALDGTREPLALPLKQPDEVAIVREGDVLSVAARDPSGGLEVLVVDGEGRLARHVRRPPEPGVAAIVPHDGGFLVLHRDQMLELLDARGARRALLPAPPGEHVLRLVARNGRTLALVRATDGVRGRWIASDALAWGEHTAKLRDDFDSVFLSPDHAYLLAVRDVPDRPIVVMHHPFAVPELHGRGVAQPATVRSRLVELATGRVRGFAPERFGDERSYEPVGFWGDGQIVIAIGDFDAGMLEWRTLGGRRDAIIGEAPGYAVDLVSVAAATVTDDAVIAFTSDQLVVVERTGPGASPRARFLGYRAARAKGVRGAPAGAVARLGSSAIVLDEELDAKRRLPSPQAIPLADDLALVQFLPRRSTPEPAIDPAWIEGAPSRPRVSVVQPRLALYDLDEDKELQRWPVARAFHYEPSTRLLAIERAGKVELATFDPAARKFSASRTFVVPVTRVALLDPTQRPAQTTAALAMFVRVRGKTSEMYAITDLDGPLPEPVTIRRRRRGGRSRRAPVRARVHGHDRDSRRRSSAGAPGQPGGLDRASEPDRCARRSLCACSARAVRRRGNRAVVGWLPRNFRRGVDRRRRVARARGGHREDRRRDRRGRGGAVRLGARGALAASQVPGLVERGFDDLRSLSRRGTMCS